MRESCKNGQNGRCSVHGLPPYGDQHGVGGFLFKERHPGDTKREDLGDKGCLSAFLKSKYQITRLSVEYRYVLASGRVIIVNIETQCSIDTHLAFEVSIVREELAHEIALESKAEYVTPKDERGFILYTIEFSVDAFFIRQTNADYQAVIKSVF